MNIREHMQAALEAHYGVGNVVVDADVRRVFSAGGTAKHSEGGEIAIVGYDILVDCPDTFHEYERIVGLLHTVEGYNPTISRVKMRSGRKEDAAARVTPESPHDPERLPGEGPNDYWARLHPREETKGVE